MCLIPLNDALVASPSLAYLACILAWFFVACVDAAKTSAPRKSGKSAAYNNVKSMELSSLSAGVGGRS